MPDVMAIDDSVLAARKATTPIALEQRAFYPRRNGAPLATYTERLPRGTVEHGDESGITCDPATRFRGNARSPIELAPSLNRRVRQDVGVNVDDDLVAVGPADALCARARSIGKLDQSVGSSLSIAALLGGTPIRDGVE